MKDPRWGPNDFQIEIHQTLPPSFGPNYQAAWSEASMRMWANPLAVSDRERAYVMELESICAEVTSKECQFTFFFAVHEV